MRDRNNATVLGKDGLTGVLIDPLPRRPSAGDTVRIRVSGGAVLSIPADSLVVASDGTYLIPYGLADLRSATSEVASGEPHAQQEGVIPVLAEELVVGKKSVPTGGVRVTRRVIEHDETVEMPLLKERVDVRRIVIHRDVDGPLPIRHEGNTTIIPIVEEEIVIQKHYRLKEEIHVTRITSEEIHRERVTVRRQEPEIEQLDANGGVSGVLPPSGTNAPPPRSKRRSILGED